MLFNTFFYLVVTWKAILFLNPLNIWFDSKDTGFADVVLQGKNKSSIQKKKSPTCKKKATIQKQLSSSDCVAAAADDDELMQVIAISFQYLGCTKSCKCYSTDT